MGTRMPWIVMLVALQVAAPGLARASIVMFESRVDFLAAVTSPGIDTYDSFPVGSQATSPIQRVAGSYLYTAHSTTGFHGAGSAFDPWLSTTLPGDTITFDGFSAGVVAVGAEMFGSDAGGAFRSGDIIVTATDGGQAVTHTIVGATTSSFFGVVSDQPPVTVTVRRAPSGGGSIWPTLDRLTLAIVPVVDGIFAEGFDPVSGPRGARFGSGPSGGWRHRVAGLDACAVDLVSQRK